MRNRFGESYSPISAHSCLNIDINIGTIELWIDGVIFTSSKQTCGERSAGSIVSSSAATLTEKVTKGCGLKSKLPIRFKRDHKAWGS